MNFLFGLAGLAVLSPAVWEGIGMARHVVIPASLKFGLSGGNDSYANGNRLGIEWILPIVWRTFDCESERTVVPCSRARYFAGIFGV